MSAREAAGLLHHALVHFPWYVALDISSEDGAATLIVYVNSKEAAEDDLSLPDSNWHGYGLRLEEFCLPKRGAMAALASQ